MKIVQLTAENVKKLKVIDITPTKDFIQITGKNGSGKSSVLDSIWWALAGKDVIQEQPIRKGEEKAIIKLDLGSMTVTRRFTAAGTTLVVENAEGFRAPSPQSMLDAIIGHLTFDPLEFSRMDAKKQFDALKVIAKVEIDLDALARLDEEDKEKRRYINRDIKNLEGQLAGITIAPDAPDEEVVITVLMQQLTELENHNTLVIDNENQRSRLKSRFAELVALKDELEEKLAEINESILTSQERLAKLPTMEAMRTDMVKDAIAGAQGLNKKFMDKKRHMDLKDAIANKNKMSDDLTDELSARGAKRLAALRESKMPIDGLTLGANEVLYNDIPFDQLSSAEQLRVSVAIAMAANPELKVIRIKDGSLLDDESLKIIQTMSADREYQVWFERVDCTGKVGIVMEEGEVVAVNDGGG